MRIGSHSLRRFRIEHLGGGVLPLLAVAAVARPGHGFESRLGDRLLANLADSVRTMSHPRECFFDGPQKSGVRLMQADLQFRFGIGIGLVNEMALRTSGWWYASFGGGLRRRQLLLFLQQ
jgi:hypothetical protein